MATSGVSRLRCSIGGEWHQTYRLANKMLYLRSCPLSFCRVCTVPWMSWIVIGFRIRIFCAWKVMELGLGCGRSWKIMWKMMKVTPVSRNSDMFWVSYSCNSLMCVAVCSLEATLHKTQLCSIKYQCVCADMWTCSLTIVILCNYLHRRLASGEGIVSLGVRPLCVCVRCISLGSEGMHCIHWSLVDISFCYLPN